ncbi:hypothetical protein GMORB2_4958 [Geosmithia morbida]|uniref:Uncharacterized protein n=1 Tax=Geosmithia morbida TaxID=1094350 RepID=A0A9P5D2W2_9HYPO|nr:uncharacterized protein GMORB2_4958 [Geosmithia morbida]KAF4124292.1 hypothetical protein GMORB2_4958 [Geosmithia morbida]
MSRVTAAPAKQLSRSLNATSRSGVLLDHNAGAVLMPKYAELLRGNEHHDSRHLTTTHRPTPQPSISNRIRPLMQTFHSTTAASSAPSPNLDAVVLRTPPSRPSPDDVPAMIPILPDNYSSSRAVNPSPELSTRSANLGTTIVAADPAKVMPSTPLSDVHPAGLDHVELKFARAGGDGARAGTAATASPSAPEAESTMLRDLWKGIVDDIFGETPAKAKGAK